MALLKAGGEAEAVDGIARLYITTLNEQNEDKIKK